MSQKVIDFFTQSCEQAGDCSWKASKMLSSSQQYAVYIILTRISDMNGCSVLDVGCGQGTLLGFLKKKFVKFEYTGIDITPKMIHYAKEAYPEGDFICDDFLTYDFKKKYDWVIAAGTFNVKVEQDQLTYFKTALQKMYDISNRGVSFTLLSKYGYDSAKDFEHTLYCYEPSAMLAHFLSMTSTVTLNHASLPAEFATHMYKE